MKQLQVLLIDLQQVQYLCLKDRRKLLVQVCDHGLLVKIGFPTWLLNQCK
jgi:hypothetical protein